MDTDVFLKEIGDVEDRLYSLAKAQPREGFLNVLSTLQVGHILSSAVLKDIQTIWEARNTIVSSRILPLEVSAHVNAPLSHVKAQLGL